MITGYNTDIRHRGTVFHIQTEDKGVNNEYRGSCCPSIRC